MSGVFINDDFANFFMDFQFKDVMPQFDHSAVGGELSMDEAGLRRQIDYYAAEGVRGILFNPNAMRAMFDSKTFDPIWEGLSEDIGGKRYFRGREVGMSFGHDVKSLCLRARELFRNVKNPYKVRYEYCREKGVEMWISMRMNDVHWASEPENIVHGTLWHDHPEFRRAAYKTDSSFWFAQCFDYARKEVYEHHLNLVKEYFERFEMDGFELDWMRSPFHFKPGFEENGRPVLTQFMRDVRKLADAAAKRSGHSIRIGVRVPTHPEEALYAGMDIFQWMEESLVDMVVPSPYFATSDAMLPIELWKRLLRPGMVLAPCLECQVSSGLCASLPANPQVDAGLASSYYYRGADAIYLFNHMMRFSGYDDFKKQREMFSGMSDRAMVEKLPRRHPATLRECIVEGIPGTSYPLPPTAVSPGVCVPVRLNVGGAAGGRSARVILALAPAEKPAFEIYLNTVSCQQLAAYPPPPLPEKELLPMVFEIPAGVLHDGENQIDLINRSGFPAAVKWVEIEMDALS